MISETDLHARAHEYASDQDRAWFAAHPGQTSMVRPPVEHELCNPETAPLCVPLTDAPTMIRVDLIGPGVRMRSLVAVELAP